MILLVSTSLFYSHTPTSLYSIITPFASVSLASGVTHVFIGSCCYNIITISFWDYDGPDHYDTMVTMCLQIKSSIALYCIPVSSVDTSQIFEVYILKEVVVYLGMYLGTHIQNGRFSRGPWWWLRERDGAADGKTN